MNKKEFNAKPIQQKLHLVKTYGNNVDYHISKVGEKFIPREAGGAPESEIALRKENQMGIGAFVAIQLLLSKT